MTEPGNLGGRLEIAQLCREAQVRFNPEIDSGPGGLSFRRAGIGSETVAAPVMLHKVYGLLRRVSVRGGGWLADVDTIEGGEEGVYPNGGNRGQGDWVVARVTEW